MPSHIKIKIHINNAEIAKFSKCYFYLSDKVMSTYLNKRTKHVNHVNEHVNFVREKCVYDKGPVLK